VRTRSSARAAGERAVDHDVCAGALTVGALVADEHLKLVEKRG
jgi:hypothetical protein